MLWITSEKWTPFTTTRLENSRSSKNPKDQLSALYVMTCLNFVSSLATTPVDPELSIPSSLEWTFSRHLRTSGLIYSWFQHKNPTVDSLDLLPVSSSGDDSIPGSSARLLSDSGTETLLFIELHICCLSKSARIRWSWRWSNSSRIRHSAPNTPKMSPCACTSIRVSQSSTANLHKVPAELTPAAASFSILWQLSELVLWLPTASPLKLHSPSSSSSFFLSSKAWAFFQPCTWSLETRKRFPSSLIHKPSISKTCSHWCEMCCNLRSSNLVSACSWFQAAFTLCL